MEAPKKQWFVSAGFRVPLLPNAVAGMGSVQTSSRLCQLSSILLWGKKTPEVPGNMVYWN